MPEGNATGQTGLELGGTIVWVVACQARGGTALSRQLGVGWSWKKYWKQVVIVFAPLLPHLLRQLEFLCGLPVQLGRLGLFQTPDLEFGKDTRSWSCFCSISHQVETFLSLIFQVLTWGRESVALPSP